MSDKNALSATMQQALAFATKHGGELVRLPGGFWCKPGANQWTMGQTYFGTKTVEALVSRGAAEYSEWQEGRSGKFPVRLRVTQGSAA